MPSGCPAARGWVSAAAAGVTARDLDELVAELPAIAEWVAGLAPDLPGLSGTDLAAPVRQPGKILALGLHYCSTSPRWAKLRSTSPMFFATYPGAVTSPSDPIELNPGMTAEVDDEVQLAVVIGRSARDVPAEHAFEHVLGYCVANDVSVRDLQRQEPQNSWSKGLDTFCPTGPWITDGDEVGDPHALRLTTTVNGKTRQDSTTGDLLFGVDQLITHLSCVSGLEPGDLILAGTPSRVGSGLKPPRYLQEGDVVVCEIENLGRPENHVLAPGGTR